jgi:tripartite-type tricarboxylate transporter receptor subunit TctC
MSWSSIIAIAFGAVAATCGVAQSQNYPTKPIRVIVANAPGSFVDVVARVVTTRMSMAMGQPFVIDNQPGAAGIPGTDQVVRASKDGYTLGMVASNHVINPSLYKVPYDALNDVTPITILGTTPMVLVVPASSPAKSVQDLLAMARAKPGKLNYGSAGSGTVGHLCAELMRSTAKIDWVHVPYKGDAGFTNDLIGGQIDAGFLAGAAAAPFVKAGKLRALAVTTPQRASSFPDVPTLADSGLFGYSLDAWVALFAPAGTPPAIVSLLQA